MTTPTTDPAPKKPGHGPRGVKHSLRMTEGQKRALRNLDKKHLIHRGRPPGSRDKALVALSELIKLAAELNGSDGNGKDGLQGWLREMCKKYPRQYLTLLGKLLPLEIKVQAQPPPLKVFQFTEDMLARFTPEQRRQLEAILGSAAGVTPTSPSFDASGRGVREDDRRCRRADEERDAQPRRRDAGQQRVLIPDGRVARGRRPARKICP